MAFTNHNILLPDGTQTYPSLGWLTKDSPWTQAFFRVLRVIWPNGCGGRTIVDLGCLEGGYTVEFARAGMEATGIEVRQSNLDNCLAVARALRLPNLHFVKDDVWNLPIYGQFDATLCCGLLYHLDRPREFLQMVGKQTQRALIVHTHYATHNESKEFALSPMTTHEGLPGRWFKEHEETSLESLEALKWNSWTNQSSFWPTKAGLLHAIRDAGFDLVFEQADWTGDDILGSRTGGYVTRWQRSMFVGIKSAHI